MSDIVKANLQDSTACPQDSERSEELVRGRGVRIERITSWGQRTPEGEWYDQAWDEWVLLSAGSGALEIEGGSEAIEMRPGDWVLLPARCRHRVLRTSDDGPTVWLAVHFEPRG